MIYYPRPRAPSPPSSLSSSEHGSPDPRHWHLSKSPDLPDQPNHQFPKKEESDDGLEYADHPNLESWVHSPVPSTGPNNNWDLSQIDNYDEHGDNSPYVNSPSVPQSPCLKEHEERGDDPPNLEDPQPVWIAPRTPPLGPSGKWPVTSPPWQLQHEVPRPVCPQRQCHVSIRPDNTYGENIHPTRILHNYARFEWNPPIGTKIRQHLKLLE